MVWITVKRREQLPCRPPVNESSKIIPAGTRADVRKIGDAEWAPHYLRHDFDVTGLPTDFDGYYHAEAEGYEMRVHRSNIRKDTPKEPKPDLPPPIRMLPVHGNTYNIRNQLRRLGGRWSKAERVWKVPEPNIEKARAMAKRAKK
jgi:hypothetical protein